MKSYAIFQLKKVLKSKLSWVVVGILLLLGTSLLFLNNSASKQTSLDSQAKTSISELNQSVKQLENDLPNYKKSDQAYKLTKKSIKENKKEIVNNKSVLTNIKNNNWQGVYKILIKQTNSFISSLKKSDDDKIVIKAATKDRNKYQYLKKHNLPYEGDESPVTGIQFLMYFSNYYVPIVFSIIIMFILSQLYTSRYKGKIDTNKVLPINSGKVEFIDIITGLIITLGSLTILFTFLFIISSIFFGSGSINYPYLINYYDGGWKTQFVPTIEVMNKVGILFLLAFSFVVLIVKLVTKFVHDRYSSLLITMILVVGSNVATSLVEPINKYVQYVPTTYLNSVGVITKNLGATINNTKVNFLSGVKVLLISNIILILIFFLLNIIKKNKPKITNK